MPAQGLKVSGWLGLAAGGRVMKCAAKMPINEKPISTYAVFHTGSSLLLKNWNNGPAMTVPRIIEMIVVICMMPLAHDSRGSGMISGRMPYFVGPNMVLCVAIRKKMKNTK